ncbi:MAG: lipopolysaccharide biosynthesis protein [Jatrophihabitans sp.]|uniref:lipopolysaccharide biosynthesis protein n=1 Tax=Jatrophihabitans sp. TaxID=1932789 RepID=UPI003F7F1FB0
MALRTSALNRGARRPRTSSLSAEQSARSGGRILVIRFAVGAVLNYALGVSLTWLLDKHAFGTVAAMQNVYLLAAGLLTASFPWVLAGRLADPSLGAADKAQQFRTALAGNLALGVVLAAAFLAAQASGVRIVPSESWPLNLTVAVEIVLLALNSVLVSACQGTRRFAGQGAMQSVEILVKTGVALALILAFHAAAISVGVAFVAGSAVATVIALRTLHDVLPGVGPLAGAGTVLSALPTWVAFVSFSLLQTADVLGLSVLGPSAHLDAAEIARYQACVILARAAYYLSDAIIDAIFPFIAANRASPYHSHRWVTTAARWIPLLIVPIQLVFALTPIPLLRLFFPAAYAHEGQVLRLVAIGTVGLVVANYVMKSLFALGRPGAAAIGLPVGAAVLIVLLAVLVPRDGITGAGIAFCAGCWIAVLVLLPTYVAVQRVREFPTRVALRYLVALVPAALAFLAASASGTFAAWSLIVVGLLVYVVSARLLKVFDDEDVDRVLGPLRPYLRRAKHAGGTS